MDKFETAADELEAIMNGSYVPEFEDEEDTSADETTEEEVEESEVEEEETEDNEDTDLSNESEDDNVDDEAETNEGIDDEPEETDEDTEETEDDEEEENAQVEGSNSGEEEEAGEADSTQEENADDSTETEENSDGEAPDTDAVDYKKQYEELQASNEKLKAFYDEVTSEFTANGKKMKGFDDPKKIIQAQQMAAGFSEKMSAFKPYRPFMTAIKEQGLLEDPAKFDLAMNVLNRDPEAIKQIIKESGIDPLDLDLENVNYAGKSYVASEPEIVLDDMLSNARTSGVEADIQRALSGRWAEDGSLAELLKNPEEAQGFVGHMVKAEDGRSAYDDVQDRVAEKLRTDYSGTFTNMTALQQYKTAAGELEREYNEQIKTSKLTSLKEQQAEAERAKAEKVEAEKKRIEAERAEKEYKAKVEQEAKKASEARRKAANLSTPKKKAKAKAKFDPIDKSQTLEGEDLMKYFNEHILGKK